MSTQTVGVWPATVPLLGMVQPWTYRDAVTMQEELTAIRKHVIELIEWSNGVSDAFEALRNRTEAVEALARDLITEEARKIREENAIMRAELEALISQVAVGGACFDPTDGSTHKPVSDVISRVYDYVRVNALFVTEIDADQQTAAAQAADTRTARKRDLSPTKDDNHAVH